MGKYSIANFCFVRTPAYPVRLLRNVYLNENSDATAKTALLKDIFKEEGIQAALHGSTSTDFFSEFQKWLRGNKMPKGNEKMEETLIRYLERMTTRCVPFGLFSGFSLADLAAKTTFELAESQNNIPHLRLDMEYIQDIIYAMKADTHLCEHLNYYSNTTVYRVNDRIKYIEYTTDTYIRKYNYAAIYYERYLDLVLKAAENGITIRKMADLLKNYDTEISEEEAREYILQLISSQLLISELEPTLTGKDNLVRLIEILERTGATETYLPILTQVRKLIEDKRYSILKAEQITSLVEQITGPKLHWSILQTDLEIRPAKNEINEAILNLLNQQLQNLSLFAFGISRPALKEFKEKFVARYDQQEIDMVEALDPEIGIGYGYQGLPINNELINDLLFDPLFAIDPVDTQNQGFTNLVVEKYIECIRNNETKVILSDVDLQKLRGQGIERELPDSYFIHGSIIAKSREELDKGNFMFQLKNLSGPPSTLTIGRFCHTSAALTEKVRTCISKEESLFPDVIYAEIVHLTDARVGNVTIRPHLRNYEIEYLGRSGSEPQNKIPITDIMVSVRNNRVVLRSKKFNKEIYPRITNAHVFTNSYLPVYAFLGEVQRSKGSDWLSWHWQNLKDRKYLPRVEYKNIILKTAKWLITKEDLNLNTKETGDEEMIEAVRGLAKKLSIPRNVSFMEELDKEFVIDLSSNISCQFLVRELNKKGQVLLEEYLQSEENCWIRDVNNDGYPNEIMVPIDKIPDIENSGQKKVETPQKQQALPERKFTVGSEWTYLKLYTSVESGERIVTGPLHQLVTELLSEKAVTSWHFLRYSDPEYHIRVRFKSNNDPGGYLKIIEKASASFAQLKANKEVHKVQIDTYDREIERYGASTMEASEQIFHIDSTACLSFLHLLESYEERDERWLWAIKAINMLLDSFEYSLQARQQLMAHSEKYFLKVLNGNNNTFKQINTKYKKYEKNIQTILSEDYGSKPMTELLQSGMDLLKQRAQDLQPVTAYILEKCRAHADVAVESLIGSYVHMLINRLFISHPNKCELVIYVMLNRYYTAEIRKREGQEAARQRQTNFKEVGEKDISGS